MSIKRKKLVIPLLALAVIVAAALIVTRPRHALIDANIPIGEDVLLTSGGTSLAASFLRPDVSKGPVPGVVMIVGSGSYSYRSCWKPGEFPMWRNFSEAFLAKGYAVLLLEKKGVNRSGGHWETQTFRDRAEDALAGVRYLKTRPDIDSTRVGVCGHSQGGWIAQLAAAERPAEIAFVVNLAGPNVSVKQQIIEDNETEWRCADFAESRIAGKSKRLRTWFDLYGALSRIVKIGTLSHIIDYDPETENVPARIVCPILAVYGEYDGLVVPEKNIPLLEKGLSAGNNTHYTIFVVPAGSHGFIRKNGICPQKFDGIPKQAPELFQTLAAWDPFAL